MKLEKSIYPYNPDAQKLPVFLSGIGGSDFQKEVDRPTGYHWHQILFCTSGYGFVEYNGTSVKINPGDYIFIPKNMPHHYFPEGDNWGINWLTFEGEYCDYVLDKFQMTEFTITTPPSDSQLEKKFEKMIHLLETDYLYCDYTCSGILYDFLIELHRYSNSSADSERSRIISLLMPALRHMHDNYCQDISMPELSKLLGITPEYFSRIFKKAMNTTPNEFLTTIRINEAKILLTQANNSIADVATKVGFNDSSYFCTVFKKREGISPSEYKRRNAINAAN